MKQTPLRLLSPATSFDPLLPGLGPCQSKRVSAASCALPQARWHGDRRVPSSALEFAWEDVDHPRGRSARGAAGTL